MKLSAPIYRLKRRAKLLARDEKIALHDAQDRVARAEGFAAWSLLSAQFALNAPARTILSGLADGDLFLLGARPGHGKILFGLELLLDAIRQNRQAAFFTLDYSKEEAEAHLRSLERYAPDVRDKLDVVISDDISADYIIRHLSGSARGTIALIDYLQILDQQRSKPALANQIRTLRDFAVRAGIVLGFVAQIDRSFDPQSKAMPDMRDIRLPNPFDPALFSKACFLHDGAVQLQRVA
jgi:predicted ATP-dependent serine protease